MQSVPSRAAPPPARVPQSRWSQIAPAALADYAPTATVAIQISGPDPDGVAERTLAALAALRYPRELLRAVVVCERLCDERLRAPAARAELALVEAPAAELDRASCAAAELVLLLAAGALPAPQCLAA